MTRHYCKVAQRSASGSCVDCAGCVEIDTGRTRVRQEEAMARTAMVPDELLMDADDVHVRALPRDECGCGKPATHQVTIDLRSAGIEVPVDRGCQNCMGAYAKRVRRGLPKPKGVQ